MSVFLKAIDVLNERGWKDGNGDREVYGISSGPVCIVGACVVAKGIDGFGVSIWERSLEYYLLSKAVEYFKPGEWPIRYNDFIAESVEDIIKVLRKAYEYECEQVKATEDSSVQQA